MTRKERAGRFEPRLITCPACRGESRYASDNPFRPFCCARCRNLDLGDWASENYRIGAEPTTAEPTTPDSNRSGHS